MKRARYTRKVKFKVLYFFKFSFFLCMNKSKSIFIGGHFSFFYFFDKLFPVYYLEFEKIKKHKNLDQFGLKKITLIF